MKQRKFCINVLSRVSRPPVVASHTWLGANHPHEASGETGVLKSSFRNRRHQQSSSGSATSGALNAGRPVPRAVRQRDDRAPDDVSHWLSSSRSTPSCPMERGGLTIQVQQVVPENLGRGLIAEASAWCVGVGLHELGEAGGREGDQVALAQQGPTQTADGVLIPPFCQGAYESQPKVAIPRAWRS